MARPRRPQLLAEDGLEHADVQRQPDHPGHRRDPGGEAAPAELDRFYRRLLAVGGPRGPYAPATIRRVHGLMRRAMTQGVRWGWVSHNPAIDASPPRVPLRAMKPPSPEQVISLFRLAQESDPDLATFIVLAASSGASRGELVALRWWDLDLDHGTLTIERGVVLVNGELIEQGTKTHQSRRITLDEATLASLLRAPSADGRKRGGRRHSNHRRPARVQPGCRWGGAVAA